MSIPDLPTRLQRCIDRLDDAIARARQDEVATVSDMESEVNALSAALLKMPMAEAAMLQGQVASMIARLDMLETELRALQARQHLTEDP